MTKKIVAKSIVSLCMVSLAISLIFLIIGSRSILWNVITGLMFALLVMYIFIFIVVVAIISVRKKALDVYTPILMLSILLLQISIIIGVAFFRLPPIVIV